MVIVDASIIAKHYLEEKDSPQAKAWLRESDELAAPSQIRLEVLSAITRRVRLGELDEASARLTCARWKKHLVENESITLIPNEELMDSAVAWSIKLKHPLADCLYLAAAQIFKAPLMTADRLFYERGHAQYKKLRLLGTI